MKCPYSEFFWSLFREFKVNTERYSVSLHIQCECREIWTSKIPNTNAFDALQCIMGKVQYPVFSNFYIELTKFSFREEDLTLGYNSELPLMFQIFLGRKSQLLQQVVSQLVYYKKLKNDENITNLKILQLDESLPKKQLFHGLQII